MHVFRVHLQEPPEIGGLGCGLLCGPQNTLLHLDSGVDTCARSQLVGTLPWAQEMPR